MYISNKKRRVVYSIIMAIAIAAIFAGSVFVIIKKTEQLFVRIQKEATAQNIRVVEGIFTREMESLSILVVDWAMWDDMYQFVSKPNQEFVTSELQNQTFSEIGINVAVIMKKDEEVLFSKQIYDQTPDETNVSEVISASINDLWKEEASSSDEDVRKTIINLGPRKLLLVSKKVTKSDGTGDTSGYVTFGRYIEKGFIKELENVPGFYFSVSPYESGNKESILKDISEENPLNVQLDNRRRVVGEKLIENLSQQPIVLEIEHIPTVYTGFIDIMITEVSFSGIAYVVTIFVTLIIFRKTCHGVEKEKENCDCDTKK
jgi:sensor domain CHASE-containing protein